MSLTSQTKSAYDSGVAAKSATGELTFPNQFNGAPTAPKMRGFSMSGRVGGTFGSAREPLVRVTSTPMRSGTQAIDVAKVSVIETEPTEATMALFSRYKPIPENHAVIDGWLVDLTQRECKSGDHMAVRMSHGAPQVIQMPTHTNMLRLFHFDHIQELDFGGAIKTQGEVIGRCVKEVRQ